MKEEASIISIDKELNMQKFETENIKNLIYTIRGKQVMLDSDVAMLYNYETKKINQTVKRNIARFPERFCFQLTEREIENLRSQFVTSSLEKENYGGRRYLPYVFTEQGIAMLSGLLRSEIAIQVSVNIMDAFVQIRKFIAINGQVFERLTNVEYKLLEHDKKFDEIFNELQKNQQENFKQMVFFDGQIELYHIGASLKDLGKKCFAISKIEDNEYLVRMSKLV